MTDGTRPSERVPSYDVLRMAATLAVVFIHGSSMVVSRYTHDPRWVWDANRTLVLYAVPSFLLISGALVWGRPWVPGPGGLREFARRRFGVIALPYVVFSILYGWYAARIGAPRAVDSLGYVEAFLTGSMWYHLYFVPIVLFVYLLTPLAARIGSRFAWLPLALAVAVQTAVSAAFATSEVSLTERMDKIVIQGAELVPFAALGALLVWWEPGGRFARRWWPAFLVAGVLPMGFRPGVAVVGTLVHELLTSALIGLAVVGLLGAAGALGDAVPALARVCERRSRETYVVYLVHPLLFIVLDRQLSFRGVHDALDSPVVLVAAMVGVGAVSFALAGIWVWAARVWRRPREARPAA